ncbi:hypothetical protein P4S73_29335 [Paraglaciecola sp. Hal342]
MATKESSRDAVKQQILIFYMMKKRGCLFEQYEEDEISDISEKVFLHIYRAYPELPSPYYIRLYE